MAEENKCPHCGKPVPPGAPGGLCPECMVKAGIGSEVAGADAGPKRSRSAPPSLEDIARHFPQLEIIQLLGTGGMGAVYKARQREIDRLVALKILPLEAGSDPGFAERFTREARALAKLSHPNIVALHEFGHVNGLHYFIMEFVDGLNLRQLEQAGQLSAREALQIIPQICEALQFAHDEGIVHRDIKPENVLLDKKGRVKIADFGLARILGHEPEDFRLTRAREVMGTPHYMAPEQVEKPQSVDHRADIYSLGVVFYEMLTGELPLGRFAPPSQKVQIDVRLDEVVLRALEKEPARRYQHASEVKTDMETIMMHQPSLTASTEIPLPRSQATPARFTRVGVLAVTGAVIALAGITAWVWKGGSPIGAGETTTPSLKAEAPPERAAGVPTSPTATPATTNALGPKIRFESLTHDFGTARSGELIKYTYVFTNAGDQLLVLYGVQGCGCISADWTRKVEPGKTGVIPIAFNSANYGGQVRKSMTVTCNDWTNPQSVIQFKGMVWRPVDIVPPMAVLNLTADGPPASVTVRLTNNLPEPISLSPPLSNNRAFTGELKTIQPGKEFQVVIAAVSPLAPESGQAQITLKTTSTNIPVITLPVLARRDGHREKAAPSGTNANFSAAASGTAPMSYDWRRGTEDTTGATSLSPEGLVIAKLTPLYLKLTLDSVDVLDSGPRYVIGIVNEAAASPRERAKRQRYCSFNTSGPQDSFILRGAKALPDDPTNATVILELKDSGERVAVSRDQPFQRIDGYAADLKYEPERKVWNSRRVGSILKFGNDEVEILAITRTEVMLRAKSNGKFWVVEYTRPSETPASAGSQPQ